MIMANSIEEDNKYQQENELELLKSIYTKEITIINEGNEFMIQVEPNVNERIELLLRPLPPDASSVSLPNATPLPTATSMNIQSLKCAQVTHLPPITLYVRYHNQYPSNRHPHCHISGRWLDKMTSDVITSKLYDMFIPGWPIVYDWVTYILSNVVEDYCILQQTSDTMTSGVRLDEEGTKNEEVTQSVARHCNQVFVRSISEFNDVEEHDHYEIFKEFQLNKHECCICYDVKMGDVFCDPCVGCEGPGLFCKACVAEYAQTMILDGRVTQMSCPYPSCNNKISDVILHELLNDKLYEKFLSLRQQVELDSIPGMVFCPRTTCGSRIISEPDSDLAVCQTCGFPFCKQCRQTWHGIESCPVFEKIKLSVANDSEDSTIVRKKDQNEIRRKTEELKSMLWLRSHRNVKECPKCSTLIQKIGGCNKMTCWKCGSYFCWLCGEHIAGYVHFDGMCKLFRDEDYLTPKEDKEADKVTSVLPDQEKELEKLLNSKCPRCGNIEQKTSNKNWMNCRHCKLPFCHQCNEPCFGRYHFNEFGCKEYTTLQEDMIKMKEDEKEDEEG